jgi:hypothetical protein
MVRQPERRLLDSGADAENLGAWMQRAKVLEGARRLSDLPVLAVLISAGPLDDASLTGEDLA